jgi:potassium efflux system protein
VPLLWLVLRHANVSLRRKPDHVTLPYFFNRTAFALHPAKARRYNQGLTERMTGASSGGLVVISYLIRHNLPSIDSYWPRSAGGSLRERAVVSQFQRIARTLNVVVVAGFAVAALAACPYARGEPAGSTPPSVVPTPQPKSAPHPATVQGADSRINTAEIVERVNKELGINLEATTASWQLGLDRLESDLARPRQRYSDLNRFRDELQRIRSETDDAWKKIQPGLDADRAQMKLLGPAPAAGQPQEPEQAALGRAELNYHFGLLSAGQATVKSTNLRIDNLLNAIQEIRRKNFASVLFQPIPGVYAYETWSKLPEYVPQAASKLRDLIADWWRDVQDRDGVTRIAVEALLMSLLLSLASWWGVRRLRRWQDAGEPPYWRRASSAAGVILLRALPVVAPVVFLYVMIADAQPLPERVDWLFYLTTQSIVTVFTVGALVTAAFAPGAPRWRLIAVSDMRAARICGLVVLLALLYSLANLLYVITRLVQAPFALTIAVALPSSLLLAGLVVALLRTTRAGAAGAVPSAHLFRALRVAIWAIVVAIVVCALTGYLPLARFLAQQLIVTGSILALVYLLLLWIDGFSQALSDDGTGMGQWLKRGAGLQRREQLTLPISLLLKFIVLVLSVPFIMLQWGYAWPDIREWYRQLFFGLHIGNTEVTLGALLASIIVFGLGYAGARLFQGWLDAQVLQTAGISGGVRQSIRTGVGYVGIMVAALAAFSYAGFNLSSLAIVAGALSVGIGFGLQNLINNFVSGLILLAERPISVGDRVVVGGEEGFVRKISVRSTELETFDGANVLIPNSYFISEKVKNWTFRNNICRIVIPIGATYGSDPRQVQSVLLTVASSHPEVLTAPEPSVTLDEFAAASLRFTLCAFVGDIAKSGRVRTDLAMSILDAFDKAGIAIPCGQTDITIRQMDWLREMIVESASLPAGRRSANGRKKSSEAAAADVSVLAK